jgi:hypothetical protein
VYLGLADAQGTINGIAPGQTGYTEAALERSKVVLSAIANNPNGYKSVEETIKLLLEKPAPILLANSK